MSASWMRTRCCDGMEIGPLDPGIVEIVEFIEHVHVVTGFKKPLDEMGADKAGSAGNQYFHRVEGNSKVKWHGQCGWVRDITKGARVIAVEFRF